MKKVTKYALAITMLMLSVGTVSAPVVDYFLKGFEEKMGGIQIVTDTIQGINPDFSVAVASASATGTSPTSPVYFPTVSTGTAYCTNNIMVGDWIFSAILMPTSKTPSNTLFKVEFTMRVPDTSNPGNPVGLIEPEDMPVTFYIATGATPPAGDIVVVVSVSGGGTIDLPTPLSWTLTVGNASPKL